MEEKHKIIITKNSTALVEAIKNITAVLDYLDEKNVFSDTTSQEIRNCQSDREKKEKLLEKIVRRGPTAFAHFYNALWKSGSKEAASLLRNRVNDEFDGHIQFDGAGSSRQVELSFGRLDLDRNQTYLMGSKPRGYMLLFNFSKYDQLLFEPRSNGKNDVANLKTLWHGLGFKVKIFEDLDYLKFFETIQKFTQKKKLKNVDSIVVHFISSIERKPNYKNKESHIFTKDGKKIASKIIIEKFDPKYCKALAEKPKLFFFQCIGVKKRRDDNMSNDFGHGVPSMSDILKSEYIFLDDPNFEEEKSNTFFVKYLIEVFSESACNTDVLTMLQKVSRRLRQVYHETDLSPMFRWDEIGFDKKLYLNPGLYN